MADILEFHINSILPEDASEELHDSLVDTLKDGINPSNPDWENVYNTFSQKMEDITDDQQEKINEVAVNKTLHVSEAATKILTIIYT